MARQQYFFLLLAFIPYVSLYSLEGICKMYSLHLHKYHMLNIILWSFLKEYMRDIYIFLSKKPISPEKGLESLSYLTS